MKVFNIYTKDLDVIAVKQGFSWPAFFLHFIWAFYKQLWGFGIILALIGCVMTFILPIFIRTFIITNSIGITYETAQQINAIGLIISIIIRIIIGNMTNPLIEKNLLSKGYQKVDMLQADSAKYAVMNYIDSKRAS